jgi:hypothetical protein
MARFTQGINGPFKGKVGTVIGASWKGIPYMRSLPEKRTSKPSEKELHNRRKWALSQQWLQPLTEFVRLGFKGYSPKSEGFVAAKSYLLRHAVEGEGESLGVNPSLVKLSWGNLPLPNNLQMTRPDGGLIQFTWEPKTYEDMAHPGDQIMLLGYNVEKQNVIVKLYGSVRYQGSDVLDLTTGKPGTFHLYAAFIAHDRSRQSDSVYFGTVNM